LLRAGWCQGFYAKNSDNKTSYVDSPHAAKFCAMGALMHFNVSEDEMERIREAFLEKHGVRPAVFNDEAKDVEEVIAALEPVLREVLG
jgi:hypothetical protein